MEEGEVAVAVEEEEVEEEAVDSVWRTKLRGKNVELFPDSSIML